MKRSFSRFFGVSAKTENESGNKLEQVEQQVAVEEAIVEAIEEAVEEKDKVSNLPVDKIVPNRFQPRTIFDEEKIDELAKTIHTHGIIQPIIVREIENSNYEIIAGERDIEQLKNLAGILCQVLLNSCLTKKRLLLL